jgi:uncharacterized integral membrane protein
MKYLLWLLKAAIFFTLFAFALNNQQDGSVHFFFGTQWRAPMVLIVLAAFALGLAVGVLGMVPRWWTQRSAVRRAGMPPATAPAAASPESGVADAATTSTTAAAGMASVALVSDARPPAGRPDARITDDVMQIPHGV